MVTSVNDQSHQFSNKELINSLSNQYLTPQARPFIKWVGGKRSVIGHLLKNLPQTWNHYYEPFVGGGALFYRIHTKAKNSFISDINRDLITTYQVIRDHLEALFSRLEYHKLHHNKEYYLSIRSQHILEKPVEVAARFIYLNKTCFNGLYRVNQKGEFNTPMGSYQNPAILDQENLLACHHLLQNVEIKLQNYTSIQPQLGDFVYFDPPYDPINDQSFTSYTSSGFDRQNQLELRDFIFKLTEQGVKVMLSNSYTPFIQEIYDHPYFNAHTIEVPRVINSNATKRKAIKEILIRNYR